MPLLSEFGGLQKAEMGVLGQQAESGYLSGGGGGGGPSQIRGSGLNRDET